MTRHEKLDLGPHALLALEGEKVVETVGELFLRQRFVTACSEPDPLFATARLEAFTRERFPRVLLDPACLADVELAPGKALADARHLLELLEERGADVVGLARLLDEPEVFRMRAAELGLTERAFSDAGGGLLGLLVLLVLAVVMTGCGGDDDPGPCPQPCAVPEKHGAACGCALKKGHELNHLDKTTHTFY